MVEDLKETVIDGDYCIGCGACSYVSPEKYSVEFDKYGKYKAVVSDEGVCID